MRSTAPAGEAAAEVPFFTFMRKNIFEPLGMDDTMADSTTESISKRSTFYFPRFAADPRYGLHLMLPIDYSCYTGASAFLTTPSDLVRFGMAINGGKLLQPSRSASRKPSWSHERTWWLSERVGFRPRRRATAE